MASYEDWNAEFVRAFTEGLPRGTTVFLAIDDEEIARVTRHWTLESDSVEDFLRAVRSRVCASGSRVSLRSIRGRTGNGHPAGVTFLCACVLAASCMAEDEDTSELNYFRRLREALNLPLDGGRPDGMVPGSEAEEPLWMEWNKFLQERGLLPSARSGEGPRKYVNYPLSQVLLRRADKDRLVRLFSDRQYQGYLDPQALGAKLHQESHGLSKHLHGLLEEETTERRAAVQEAIYECYEAWREDSHAITMRPSGVVTRNLRLGLFRTEDFITGAITYHAYPRAPRGRTRPELTTRRDGEELSLTEERPGWLYPFGVLSTTDLNQGTMFEVKDDRDIAFLVLPGRRFWIMVRDPENPTSGAFGTWTGPQLGEPFILLMRDDLMTELQALKEEGLVMWDGEPVPVLDKTWVELRNCMAVSEAWSGVFIRNAELFEALKPSARLSIGAAGGLRVPQRGGWLEGYGPEVTVFSFYKQADVRVVRIDTGETIMEASCDTGQPIEVPWDGPGDYRVEAEVADHVAQRVIKLVPWEEIEVQRLDCRDSLELSGVRIAGARIG